MEFEIDHSEFLKYFNQETEIMAAPGYAESKEATLRQVAVKEIVKNSKSEIFDAFVPYLAMNYFDRFISRNQLPNVLGRVRDDIVLAAICCLTIAWKMRDDSFSLEEFLLVNKLSPTYEKHILDMEVQILNGLNWRMRAVVAICFVSFFLGRSSVKDIKRRVINDIIIQAQGDIGFTLYKPSVIAAAAVVSACQFLIQDDNVEMPPHMKCRESLLETSYVKTEELDSCRKKMIDMCTQKGMYIGKSHDGEASSSSASGPPKEPKHETEKKVEEPGLDFELKWLLGIDVQKEVIIYSPLFRPPAPASGGNNGTDPAEAIDETSTDSTCRTCT